MLLLLLLRVLLLRLILISNLVVCCSCFPFLLRSNSRHLCAMVKRCTGKHAESKPEKIARLQSLKARLPHVSQSALASLLAIAQREKLPEVKYRQEVRDAQDLAENYDFIWSIASKNSCPNQEREIC